MRVKFVFGNWKDIEEKVMAAIDEIENDISQRVHGVDPVVKDIKYNTSIDGLLSALILWEFQKV